MNTLNFKRFLAVFSARNKEFLRDRAALSWNILFPVLIVAGFAYAFSGGPADMYKVGIYNPEILPYEKQHPFFSTKYLQLITVTNLQQSIIKIERHQLDMLFDISSKSYWVNDESPSGYVLEKLLGSAESSQGIAKTEGQFSYTKQSVSGSQIRYIDWLIPGVMGMNIMFSALFGVGYVIVRYRKNGVLKRLKATPLTAFEFLAAQVVSRFLLIMLITVFVYMGVDLFVTFSMFGSYIDLLFIFALGTLSMISMGLLIAARLTSEETAGGLLNVISWPMMFLSGVWFSLEGLNPLFQKLALAFPLTHLIDGARAIMIDGAGISEIYPQIFTLLLMTIVFLVIGAYSFKWE